MRFLGIKSVRRAKRWLVSRFTNRALILGYHRIAQVSPDPYRICVSPENFAAHMEILSRLTSPVSLPRLISSLAAGQLSNRPVAVTFDDGYTDLFDSAIPLLEKVQIPATVFIISGSIGRQPWWDRLEAILRTPASLPDQLEITIGGKPFEWYSREANSKKNSEGTGDDRERLLSRLYAQLRHISPEEREHVIASLPSWTGFGTTMNSTSRILNELEIKELAASGLIEIGSHSVTHPWLAVLPEAEQRKEIYESKSCLEHILGRSVNSFSYPNGSTSAAIGSLVRQAGYTSACTSDSDMVRVGSNAFHLPRFWIPNWGGATFERWLRKWM